MIDRESLTASLKALTRPLSFRELLFHLGLSHREGRALKRLLKELVREGQVVRTRKGVYGPPEEMSLVTGRFEAHREGFGFVIPDKPGERDVFIPARAAGGAMHTDRVVARLQSQRRREGAIVRVLQRGVTRIAGTFDASRNGCFVRPVNNRPDDGVGQPNRSIAIGLGDVELINRRGSTTLQFRTTLLSLREEEVSRLSPAQGPLDATLTLRAWRYRLDEAAPLAVGSTVSARQGRLAVRAITPTPDGVVVDLQRVFLEPKETTPDTALGGRLGSREYLMLRNRARKQAMLAAGETGRRLLYSMLDWFLVGRLGTGTLRLHFLVPTEEGGRAVPARSCAPRS